MRPLRRRRLTNSAKPAAIRTSAAAQGWPRHQSEAAGFALNVRPTPTCPYPASLYLQTFLLACGMESACSAVQKAKQCAGPFDSGVCKPSARLTHGDANCNADGGSGTAAAAGTFRCALLLCASRLGEVGEEEEGAVEVRCNPHKPACREQALFGGVA